MGVNIKAKCKKNKVGMPFRECSFSIKFGYGIDDLSANVRYLTDTGKLGVLQPGLTPDGAVRFISNLEAHNGESLAMWRKKIEEAVAKVWQDIEKKFLPIKSKYA